MGKNLTINQKAQIANPVVKSRTLVTLDLAIGPMRFLENDTIASLTVNSNVYSARMIQRSEIETSLDGNTDKMSIVIADIWKDFSTIISNNGDILTNGNCKVEEVIFDGDSNTIIDNPVL